jgi:multicomponent Na+:H+ antiporter subunit C
MVEFSASALDRTYSNPLPHVLILTAIVVGVASLAVGLALVVLIREAYGTIEEDEVHRAEHGPGPAGEHS